MNSSNTIHSPESITKLYKLCRDGDILELATTELAHTTLIESSFVDKNQISHDARGRAVCSLLRWATDSLRPGGEFNWINFGWRNFNALNYFYFEGWRVADLAEKMAIANQTLYQVRADALQTVSVLLEEELNNPTATDSRLNYAVADRYEIHSAEQKTILRILATFGQTMPVELLQALAENVSTFQNEINTLLMAGWLISNEAISNLMVYKPYMPYLRTQCTVDERRRWHRAIADHFLKTEAFELAATHRFETGDHRNSAEIIITHHQAIINNLNVEELATLIDRFTANQLHKDQWAQLKIIRGDIARLFGNIDEAIDAYQYALSAEDVGLKALAYYRRGDALKVTNLDEAIAHFSYSIQSLERTKGHEDLLSRTLIGRAHIYFQRNNFDLAEKDLEQAGHLIDPADRELWSFLQTALFRLHHKRNDLEKAATYGQDAWLAANEIQDIGRMANMSHNLGMVYARLGRHAQSRKYLEISQDLAGQTGNAEMEAASLKTLGGLYFLENQLPEAIDAYLQARSIFQEIGHQNWLAYTDYDLAEAYGILGEQENYSKHLQSGTDLAKLIGGAELLTIFATLKEKYEDKQPPPPPIHPTHPDLNDRQQAAIQKITEEGGISNRQYQEMTGVSARQSLRELRELEEKGLLTRKGQGRATRYILT